MAKLHLIWILHDVAVSGTYRVYKDADRYKERYEVHKEKGTEEADRRLLPPLRHRHILVQEHLDKRAENDLRYK